MVANLPPALIVWDLDDDFLRANLLPAVPALPPADVSLAQSARVYRLHVTTSTTRAGNAGVLIFVHGVPSPLER